LTDREQQPKPTYVLGVVDDGRGQVVEGHEVGDLPVVIDLDEGVDHALTRQEPVRELLLAEHRVQLEPERHEREQQALPPIMGRSCMHACMHPQCAQGMTGSEGENVRNRVALPITRAVGRGILAERLIRCCRSRHSVLQWCKPWQAWTAFAPTIRTTRIAQQQNMQVCEANDTHLLRYSDTKRKATGTSAGASGRKPGAGSSGSLYSFMVRARVMRGCNLLKFTSISFFGLIERCQ
jgi:hypothetical protein